MIHYNIHYNSGKQWEDKKSREKIFKLAKFYYEKEKEEKLNIKKKE